MQDSLIKHGRFIDQICKIHWYIIRTKRCTVKPPLRLSGKSFIFRGRSDLGEYCRQAKNLLYTITWDFEPTFGYCMQKWVKFGWIRVGRVQVSEVTLSEKSVRHSKIVQKWGRSGLGEFRFGRFHCTLRRCLYVNSESCSSPCWKHQILSKEQHYLY